MIHFRFFLISIVGVFLALGIGIVLGSGLLGGPLLETLERQVDDVIDRNGRLQSEVLALEDQVERSEAFATTVEPMIVEGMLQGLPVVVLELDGSDGVLYEGLDRVVEEAGGNIAARVIFRDRLALEDENAIEDATRIAGLETSDRSDARSGLADVIASRLSEVAAGDTALPGTASGEERVAALLDALEEADFVSVEDAAAEVVPRGAAFVVLGGGGGDPPFESQGFVDGLVTRIATTGPRVVVAESSEGEWGLTALIRSDEDAAAVASTVDNVDKAQGRIALAVTLRSRDSSGHWGTGEGAVAPLPTPAG